MRRPEPRFDMRSVNVNTPKWAFYELATMYERDVAAMGRKYGADEVDCSQIATGVVVAICMRSDIRDWNHAKQQFFSRVKGELLNFRSRREMNESEYLKRFEDPPENIWDMLPNGRSRDRAVSHTYLQQVLRDMKNLPTKVQKVMALVAEEYTPIDIANELGWDLRDVMRMIKIARDWLESMDHGMIPDAA